jgi:hypothetical protein
MDCLVATQSLPELPKICRLAVNQFTSLGILAPAFVHDSPAQKIQKYGSTCEPIHTATEIQRLPAAYG